MKTLLLIDANALVHRAFHALPPLTTPAGEPIGAVYGLTKVMLKIFREKKPDFIAAAFDRPETTFRKEKYEQYKIHRPKAPDELVFQLKKSRELMEKFGVAVFETPGLEADDLIGSLAEKFKKEPDLRIIVFTGDLDALQLVINGKVVVETPKKGVGETKIYDEEAVRERYGVPPGRLIDFKGLVGDPSDNIPGVPGVGPKTAADLLGRFGTLEGVYANLEKFQKGTKKEQTLFTKLSGHREQAFLSKDLATIRRDAPLAAELSGLKAPPLPKEALADYFGALGFRSLVARINGENGESEKRPVESGERKEKSEKRPAAGAGEGIKIGEREKESGKRLFFLPEESGGEPPPKEILESPEIFKIGFNLKPFFKVLKKKGLFLKPPFFDVQIAAWLIGPDGKNFDWQSVCLKLLKESRDDFRSALPALFEEAEKKLKENGLSDLFEKIEMPLVKILAAMEERGIKTDGGALKSLNGELDKELKRLEEEIRAAAGEKFNVNSPKQLAEILFEKLKIPIKRAKRTASGALSTDAESLLAIKGVHPIIAPLLEYREAFKLKTTYVEPMAELTSPDGRLRTTFVQTGTATGRLSSQNPNLQNVPQEFRQEFESPKMAGWIKALRRSFVAEEGFSLAAFDYSQVELRILASVSGDEKMLDAFARGLDIHKMTAAQIFNVPLSEVTPKMRNVAKTLNFGVVYGMGPLSFAKTSGLSRDEAKKFIGEYFDDFPQVRIWQEKTKEEAKVMGFVKTEMGRKRWLPQATSFHPRFLAEAERAAINMPIQGLAADIIKSAMIAVGREIGKRRWEEKVRLLLSIHDELLFEIESDILKEASAVIGEIMENIYQLKAPLKIKSATGGNWDELMSAPSNA